ncbi:hypothetical protein ABID23_000138 [Bartonella silvatica]|uniref:Uncharacterized protein n=1 Tax=Bartonella silvatica TaxID=357760 RepID=A0ABV2HEW1_9HYPH
MFKFALCFFFLFPFVSYAQEKKQETDNHSLTSYITSNYPLTEDFLLKLEKIENECKNLLPKTKNDLVTYDSSVHSSVENYAAYISSNPKLMKILKENNITLKDFAAGTLTLREISAFLVFVPEEEYSNEKDITFLNNLEFVKKHFFKITSLSENCEELIRSSF